MSVITDILPVDKTTDAVSLPKRTPDEKTKQGRELRRKSQTAYIISTANFAVVYLNSYINRPTALFCTCFRKRAEPTFCRIQSLNMDECRVLQEELKQAIDACNGDSPGRAKVVAKAKEIIRAAMLPADLPMFHGTNV
jgi:hypothetical protein